MGGHAAAFASPPVLSDMVTCRDDFQDLENWFPGTGHKTSWRESVKSVNIASLKDLISLCEEPYKALYKALGRALERALCGPLKGRSF